ncbi:S8 family serine peptidase [Streptomyces sp. DH37]|uniref:S8 family serine peptidase n=1 Tax=Streptomyces sp. DH37 TaxID=3040122 RepID=UPI002442186D|nr:S8 family serine peptidase [Streptomyces sp. DH37]MDG9706458.1 S8 family serine peptidase [Streptomyces sp. DH37]
MARVLSRPLRTAGAAAATALVVLAPPGARPAAAGEPVRLPGVSTRLADGAPCAKASDRTAEARPWTWQALGLPQSWRLARGDGVTVAVVDTGVGTGIPALSGRVTALDGAGRDCVGHGSFAAGLIAAAPADGTGVAGVAPRARILAVRGTDERGTPSAGRVARGVRAAVDAGADVVYVAHALPTGRKELTAAVAHATGNDVLVVAPTAPDAAPLDPRTRRPDPTARPYFPAFVPQVLSVVDHGPGGTRPEGAPQPFAPDLSAPGDLVVSVGPRGSGHYIGSGSSLAAAAAAGAAALVRARHPELSAAEVARRLMGAAYPATVPRLDPYAALSALLPEGRQSVPEPEPAPLPPSVPHAPRHRALVLAGGAGLLVLLVAAAAVVVPRGRARGWRPAGG